jgi:hypothetical protein
MAVASWRYLASMESRISVVTHGDAQIISRIVTFSV